MTLCCPPPPQDGLQTDPSWGGPVRGFGGPGTYPPLFPWRRLAEQGIGAWPDAQRVAYYLQGRASYQPVETADLLDVLSRYGYQVTPEMTQAQQKRVIMAFQMHFRPECWDGVADAQTLAIAVALLEKYGRG